MIEGEQETVQRRAGVKRRHCQGKRRVMRAGGEEQLSTEPSSSAVQDLPEGLAFDSAPLQLDSPLGGQVSTSLHIPEGAGMGCSTG